jgi:hypothetical protein
MNASAIRKTLGIDHLSQFILPWTQVAMFIIGAVFWAMATIQAAPFDAETFGDFALQYPAEAWAMAMMGPAAMVWVGLRNPVKHWMVAIGAGMQFLNFCALSYSFLWTGGQPVMGLFAIIFFAPLHAYIFGAAVNDT